MQTDRAGSTGPAAPKHRDFDWECKGKKRHGALGTVKTALLLSIWAFQHLPLRCSTHDVRAVQVERPTAPVNSEASAQTHVSTLTPPSPPPGRCIPFSFSLRLLLVFRQFQASASSSDLNQTLWRLTTAVTVATAAPDAGKVAGLHFVCFSFQRKEKHETQERSESHAAAAHVIVCVWVWTETDGKKKKGKRAASLRL